MRPSQIIIDEMGEVDERMWAALRARAIGHSLPVVAYVKGMTGLVTRCCGTLVDADALLLAADGGPWN